MHKILIEIPTWLGDCIMATPAIENIIKHYPNSNIIIFGSSAASAVFKNHPNVKKIIIDDSRLAKNRYFWLYKNAKKIKFDVIFSFRRQLSSKFFAFFVSSKSTYHYKRYNTSVTHQVIRYNNFVNYSLGIKTEPKHLKIYKKFDDFKQTIKPKKILGINPGASYGSAKRWHSDEFAKLASRLSNEYDIIIFGGKSEANIANDIEKLLTEYGIKNYQNLAGKTTVNELFEKISQLSLFITGDSGPMHIAAAFQIPTTAIFGSTKDSETSQWMNKKSIIVKQQLDCQPCMKRTCPKKHHNCMKQIKAEDVFNATQQMLNQSSDKSYAQ